MWWIRGGWLALAACGRIGFDAVAAGGDGGADSPAACTTFGSWTAPRKLALGPGDNTSPWISEDGLELVFASNRDAFNFDIYRATRLTTDVDFDPPQLIDGAINTAQTEDNPYLSPDGLTLWFDRSATLRVATRPTRTAPFDAGATVPELDTAGSSSAPWLTPDLMTIMFASDRAGSPDIYIAHRAAPTLPFGAPTRVDSIATVDIDSAPASTSDGATMLFSRGPNNLQLAIMQSDGGPAFGPPTMFLPIVPGPSDADPYLSADGRRLLWTSTRGGNYELYIIERDCI